MQTSHSTTWLLYLVGKNPNIGERIHDEITDTVSGNDNDLWSEMERLKIVNNVIREALRIYPVAPFLTRKLYSEANLGGYSVPSGVSY